MPDLLQDKSVHLKMGDYITLADPDKRAVIDVIEQEYLAYLFINNSNAKLHNQLKKDIANNYSKGNIEAYSGLQGKNGCCSHRYKNTVCTLILLPTYFLDSFCWHQTNAIIDVGFSGFHAPW